MNAEVVVPLHTVSEANRRDHWSVKHRRAATQKQVVTLMLRSALGPRPRSMRPPYRVRLTRLAPGAIRDSDNLYSATKAIRDAVAAFLGVDDADLLSTREVSWSVAQEKHATYAVRIEISGTCADDADRVASTAG